LAGLFLKGVSLAAETERGGEGGGDKSVGAKLGRKKAKGKNLIAIGREKKRQKGT